MTSKRIQVGVIGAGNITNRRHIPALQEVERSKIVGVIDRHEDRARRTARKFAIPYFGTSMQEPWFTEVQAVTVGVPPTEHARVATEALCRGKHVLLEKPMTVRLKDAINLRDLAHDRRLILAVVHNFQFAHAALQLRNLLLSGRLGEIRGILCFQTSTTERRLPEWHEALPLGLFYDEAPHLLYLLQRFGGKRLNVDSVSISSSREGRSTPGVLTAHIQAGGIPSVLYCNFEAPVSEWHFAVYGETGVAVIDIFRDVLVRMPHDHQHLPRDILRTSAHLLGTHLSGTVRSGFDMLRGRLLFGNVTVVERFLEAVITGEPPDDISASDGLQVMRLQHQLVEAAGIDIGD